MRGQGLGDKRVARTAYGPARVQLHAHITVGVQNENILVHRVVGAIGGQPLAHGCRVRPGMTEKMDNIRVGGQKTHVRRAFVEITLDDVNGHLGHGGHFPDSPVQRFFGQHGGEVLPQGGKGVSGLEDEVEQGGRNGVAVDLACQGNPGPLAFQLGKNILAAPDFRHKGKEGLQRGLRARSGVRHGELTFLRGRRAA